APVAMAATRRDAFLQLDELKAALRLGRAGRRGLTLAAGLHGLLGLAWFHDGTPFRINSGLRWYGAVIPRRADRAPRRGRAGAGLACGKTAPAPWKRIPSLAADQVNRAWPLCKAVNRQSICAQAW